MRIEESDGESREQTSFERLIKMREHRRRRESAHHNKF